MRQDVEDRKSMDTRWDKLNNRLKNSTPNFTEPTYPFKAQALIRDFNPLYEKIYDKEKYVNM